MLEQRIWMEHGRNTTYVQFTMLAGEAQLHIAPLMTLRSLYALTHGYAYWRFGRWDVPGGVALEAFPDAPPILLLTEPPAPLQGEATWYWQLHRRWEARRGYPADVIYAIKSHADYLTDCPRVSRLDKTLYACDELAGFLMACAMVRPERLAGMQPSSVKKKLKNKAFAASINRDDIARGAADLGVELDEHIQFVIEALHAIAADLGLADKP